MSLFTNYNKVIFDAFINHNKRQEVLERKQEILNKILEYYNTSPESYLFVGFNPVILELKNKDITLIETDNSILDWLKQQKIKVKVLESANNAKFDCVVAWDEYLTFCDTDEEFKNKVNLLSSLTKNLLLTTIKDYKNQDFKDREYSIPALIKNNKTITAYTEIHDWSVTDKNLFKTFLYELNGSTPKFCGEYVRKPVYFKQLARFCTDAGANNFLVHKNLMYKSLIKKNYEHVISINFEKEFDN